MPRKKQEDALTDHEKKVNERYRFCRPDKANEKINFTRFLNELDEEKIQGTLVRLWEHWPVVLGEKLASSTSPLGHKKKMLIIGCENSMAIQDVRMQQEEILERVNAFFGKTAFTKLRVELMLNHTDLASPLPKMLNDHDEMPRPNLTGKFLSDIPSDSPVGRCYAHFFAKCKS